MLYGDDCWIGWNVVGMMINVDFIVIVDGLSMINGCSMLEKWNCACVGDGRNS